jgi:hypothetical protein
VCGELLISPRIGNSLQTRLPGICRVITIRRMARTSATESKQWGSRKSSRRHAHPWQNAYVECVIGSIRRECLDHLVIFNERHLRRVLASNIDYCLRTRTHLSLDKDCPDPHPIMPRRIGKVVAILGGLHNRYERLAA